MAPFDGVRSALKGVCASLGLLGFLMGSPCVAVPTRFLKSWIEAHYVDRVLATYRAEAPAVQRISIGVRGTLAREARKPAQDHQASLVKPSLAMPLGARPPAPPSASFGSGQ